MIEIFHFLQKYYKLKLMEQINIESIKKEIDYHISVKNNFWNAIVLSLGGTLGLVFISNSLAKAGLIATGIFFTLIFIKGYFNRYERIECLIKKLSKMR